MRYKLDHSKLAPGDVILVGTPDNLSKEVRERTNCDYSHAMLMWDDSLLHASKVIIPENPSRMLYDEGSKACVLGGFWYLSLEPCPSNPPRTQFVQIKNLSLRGDKTYLRVKRPYFIDKTYIR